MLKKIFTAFIVTVSILSVSFSSVLHAQESGEVVTISTDGSFFPIIYTNDKGELDGFEYAVLTEIAERSGFEIDWEIMSGIDSMFGALDTGRIDTIAYQIAITKERSENYDFTIPYANNEIRLVVREDDPAQSIKDLHGKKVCIAYGTVLQTFFEEYNKTIPEDEQIITVVTEGNIYEELELGRYDAFPMTVLSFDQVKEKGEYNLRMLDDAIIVDYAAFPFQKGANPELVESFNTAIKEMQEDGTMAEFSLEHYGIDVSEVDPEANDIELILE